MSPPVLTWNIVGPLQITSGNITFNAGQKPKSHIMSTLTTLINSSTYWQVEISDTTGSAVEALVLRPNASLSAIPNMRIIATMNQTGALGGAANALTMQDRTAGTVDTYTANTLQVGFSPNISNSPTWVTGSWNSDKPWGANVRFSKYWAIAASQNASIDQMYLIESSETLLIGLKGRKGDTAHFAWYGGAIIAAFDSGSGESNERVYGMSTVATSMASNFNGNASLGPFGHSTGTGSDRMGVFIVSGGIANTYSTGSVNQNYWELCTKLRIGTFSSQGDGGDRGTTTTTEDTLVALPIAIASNAAPYRMIGYARQAYMIQDFPALLPIATGVNGSSVVGYTFGRDVTAANDTVAFLNF